MRQRKEDDGRSCNNAENQQEIGLVLRLSDSQTLKEVRLTLAAWLACWSTALRPCIMGLTNAQTFVPIGATARRSQIKASKSHLFVLFNFGTLSDMNKTIGIAVAKARLFEIVDRVESGETIIIARNGAPVAQLRPLERESEEDAKRIRAIGQRAAKRNKAVQ